MFFRLKFSIFYSLCMSVRNESHKLLASMSVLRYCSRMLVSTATELSSTPLTSWPGATHTHIQNQYHWQPCGVDGCCDDCIVSPLKNCCSASFSPSTWTGSLPPPGSMVSSRGCCRRGGRRDRAGEWAADCKIFLKMHKEKESHADFCSAVHFSQFVRNLLLEGGGLSAELGFWLVGKTISG